MILARIRVEQIAEYWNLICWAIASSLPPSELPSQEVMTQLLYQAMAGKLQVWALNKDRLVGIGTTIVRVDELTKSRSLLIYSLYVWQPMHREDYEGGLETLVKFARAEGCSRIEFFTVNHLVKELAKAYGFFTEMSYGVLHLGEEGE